MVRPLLTLNKDEGQLLFSMWNTTLDDKPPKDLYNLEVFLFQFSKTYFNSRSVEPSNIFQTKLERKKWRELFPKGLHR